MFKKLRCKYHSWLSSWYRKRATKLANKSKKHYCKYYNLHKELQNVNKG